MSVTHAAPDEAGWTQALEDFATELRRKGLRHSTIKGYRCHLRTLAETSGGGPWTVGGAELRLWLDARGSSRRASWAAARSFYGWAKRAGLVAASPVPPASPAQRVRDTMREDAVPAGWRAPLREFADYMHAGGRRPRTVSLWLSILRRFALQHPEPYAVTTACLTSWLAAQEWAPETRKSARIALRAFYRRAVAAGHMTSSPGEELASVRVPRALPRPTTADAYRTALLEANDRDRLMLLLAGHAGLRAAEIAQLHPVHDLVDGFLYVVGKGGDQRRVPVHPLVAAEIEEELARRRAGGHGTGFRWTGDLAADGFLFPSPTGGHIAAGSVSRRLSAILPGAWTGHTLRHRFASETYAATRDLRAVQELLGHASPLTTARYTATPDAALRAAVLGLA